MIEREEGTGEGQEDSFPCGGEREGEIGRLADSNMF